ncbi:hypothetical protein GCM10010275_10100 [Streptomyces litmocidini]|nr:hypothetical protein GCM10010275_10100 [Streptomyces litmocidini]
MSSDKIRAIELLSRVSYGRVATSMRAMPFVAPARHVVADGRVLLRMHRGLGYHRACNGSVVAYGADNCDSGADHLWSVQFTGTAEVVEPTPEERAAFGPEPVRVDGEPFTPVFLRIEPQFVTVHELDYGGRAEAGTQGGAPAEGPAEGSAGSAFESPSGPSPGAAAGASGARPSEAGSGTGVGAGPQDAPEAEPAAVPGTCPEAEPEAAPDTCPGARPPAGSEHRREARPGHPSVERRLHHAA